MSRRGSILIVHQIPSGTKRGGYVPYTREGAIPSAVPFRLAYDRCLKNHRYDAARIRTEGGT